MTMPSERARALRFAHEVLSEVRSRSDVPEDLRYQALVTLRHLPTPSEISYAASLPTLGWWIEPEQPLEGGLTGSASEPVTPDANRMGTDVWTVWMRSGDEGGPTRSFVLIAYAVDERAARTHFAVRFGVEAARQAKVSRGIAINEVTQALIPTKTFEAVAELVNSHREVSVCAQVNQD
jgi:hypothetical protein